MGTTIDTSLDAVNQKAGTSTVALDAVSQQAKSRTASLDALKTKEYTKTLSLDGLVGVDSATVKNVTPVYGLAGQFNHGSSDSDISYIVLTNASGTPCFVYPNGSGNGITVSTTRP